MCCSHTVVSWLFNHLYCRMMLVTRKLGHHYWNQLERVIFTLWLTTQPNTRPMNWAYSTIEKEVLAMVLAVEKFDLFLSSTSYVATVFIGHNNQIYLSSVKKKNTRLMRWTLRLQLYNLTICHIPAKTMCWLTLLLGCIRDNTGSKLFFTLLVIQ